MRSETETGAAERRPGHDVEGREVQELVDEIFARAKFTTRHLRPIATLMLEPPGGSPGGPFMHL